MTDLLREAIADAKAVREVALANAKMALEEAFTPRIQSMLSKKLSEEAEQEYNEGEEDTMDEEDEMGHDSEVEEAWNEGWNEGEEHSEEMEEGEDHSDIDVDETFMAEEDGEEMPEETPEFEDETDFEEEEPMDEDLMEIIRQLEEELDSSEIGKGDNKQPSKTASDDHTEMKKEPLVQVVNEEEEEEEVHEAADDEDVDIQEIINALREEEEEEMHEGDDEEATMEEGEDHEETAELKDKVQEAYAVIKFLREKLNEVNLLNSKLLFSNKLFRSHSLTETQKMTVIENFDRAGSLREVKLVYATLAEALKSRSATTPKTPKVSIKESLNSGASRPQASTRPSKKILTESNGVADRFKKLAGII